MLAVMSRQLSGQKRYFRWWVWLPLLAVLLLVQWAQASPLMLAPVMQRAASMTATQLASQSEMQPRAAHCQFMHSTPPLAMGAAAQQHYAHSDFTNSLSTSSHCAPSGDACDMHCEGVDGCHSSVSGWVTLGAGFLAALAPPSRLDAAWQSGFYVSIVAPNLDRPPSFHV